MIALNHYGHHISMQRPYIDFSDKSRSSFQEKVLSDLSLTGRIQWSWWNPVKMLPVHLQNTCAAVISGTGALWHAMGRTAEGIWGMT